MLLIVWQLACTTVAFLLLLLSWAGGLGGGLGDACTLAHTCACQDWR